MLYFQKPKIKLQLKYKAVFALGKFPRLRLDIEMGVGVLVH